MTKQQLTERLMNGELLLVGEFRNGKADSMRWRDKTSKQIMSQPLVRFNLETKNGTAVVSNNLPDGTDLAKVQIAFKQGDMVVCSVESASMSSGVLQLRGNLEAIE